MDPLPNKKQLIITAAVGVIALIQGFATAVGIEVGFLDGLQEKIEQYAAFIVLIAMWALRKKFERG